MLTRSMGLTTYEELRQAMQTELGEKPYTMSLALPNAQVVKDVVNQGIDGHLEACFVPARGDSYEWDGRRLNCQVSQESLPVLLRRLYEQGSEEAVALRGSILETLEIEEI